jgi:hypothetical protein
MKPVRVADRIFHEHAAEKNHHQEEVDENEYALNSLLYPRQCISRQARKSSVRLDELLAGVLLSARRKVVSSTGLIFFQGNPRPNRRRQINQTKQQQSFRGRDQQHESGKEQNNYNARRDCPTDKCRQFISRCLNIIEAQAKHKHSINPDPNFIRRRRSENPQNRIWYEQQKQA